MCYIFLEGDFCQFFLSIFSELAMKSQLVVSSTLLTFPETLKPVDIKTLY